MLFGGAYSQENIKYLNTNFLKILQSVSDFIFILFSRGKKQFHPAILTIYFLIQADIQNFSRFCA